MNKQCPTGEGKHGQSYVSCIVTWLNKHCLIPSSVAACTADMLCLHERNSMSMLKCHTLSHAVTANHHKRLLCLPIFFVHTNQNGALHLYELTKVQRSMHKGDTQPAFIRPSRSSASPMSPWQADATWDLWQAGSYSFQAHH